MLKTIWQNFKTTFFGAISGGTLIQQGIEQKNIALIISGVAAFAVGLFASDSSAKK